MQRSSEGIKADILDCRPTLYDGRGCCAQAGRGTDGTSRGTGDLLVVLTLPAGD